MKESALFFVGGKRALLGGLITGAIVLAGQFLVGLAYSESQALTFLNSLLPASRFLASSIVTASATILALMLTIISISSGSSKQLEARFFRQVRNIARLDTVALAGSILLLLIFNFPLEERQALPGPWFDILYYVLLVTVAGITGLFIGTILMLYEAVQDLIIAYHPTRDSDVVVEDGEESTQQTT